MDVYGYSNYPYNQSDELAKQMYAQQALSTIPYNRGVTEPHNMPVPTGSPWNVQGLPWGMSSPPQLVQFTAQPPEQTMSPVIHCKRKSLDVEPVIPAKQLITEEKMAAHLNSLHISSEYTPHSLSTDDLMDVNMDVSQVNDKLKGHTIVLSDELKALQERPLIPAALIERLEKPRMSLVVWKPRENILEKIKEDEKNSDGKPKQRNGVLVPQHPVIDDVDM